VRYTGNVPPFNGCRITIRQGGSIFHDGSVDLPGGWSSGESFDVIIYSNGHDLTSDTDISIWKGASKMPARGRGKGRGKCLH
jgi:hypothetical protein